MSVFPGPSNPIVYAQFVLHGGWKRMLLIAVVYGLLVGGLMWLTTLANPHLSRSDAIGYIAVTAGLQTLNVLMFGSFLVESAVRRDITSRMIESHRLMPAPPLGSILGYVLGAPQQVFLLAIVNYILGGIWCLVGGLPLAAWTFTTVVGLFGALVVYAVVMQLAFLIRGGFLLLLIVGFIVLPAMASGSAEIIPGINILLSPLISRDSAFVLMIAGGGSVSPHYSSALLFAYSISFLAQAIIIAVAIRVGIRRYLSPTLVGISPSLGLIILATWVGLMITGMNNRHFALGNRYSVSEVDQVMQFVCAIASMMLVAVLPIASAAKTARLWRRSGAPEPSGAFARASELWTLGCTIVIAVALLLGIHAAALDRDFPAIPVLALIVVNFFISIACLFSQGYIRGGRPWILVSIWIPVTWFAPVIADAIITTATNNGSSPTSLTSLSPPGAIGLLLSHTPVSVQGGVVIQLLLTAIPLALLFLSRRRAAIQRAMPSGGPPAGISPVTTRR